MEKITKEFGNRKKITVFKRDHDSLFPDSIYVCINDGGESAYLEEAEIEWLKRQISRIKKDSD